MCFMYCAYHIHICRLKAYRLYVVVLYIPDFEWIVYALMLNNATCKCYPPIGGRYTGKENPV